MASIWEAQTRFKIWFEIGRMRRMRWQKLGRIRKRPRRRSGQGQGRHLQRRAHRRNERETKHDVIAFLTHLAEIVGPRRASCIRA